MQKVIREKDIMADIKISNEPPLDPLEKYAEFYIGNTLKQKIWICCNEKNPTALEFFDFIIAKLLPLYARTACARTRDVPRRRDA